MCGSLQVPPGGQPSGTGTNFVRGVRADDPNRGLGETEGTPMGSTNDARQMRSDDLEREAHDLRTRLLIRYEREIDPDSAYVLSDYLRALSLDAREALADADADRFEAVLQDVLDLRRDTEERLDAGPDVDR